MFRRRRPTLEVHVPLSPTPTMLNMAQCLALSLRRFGGEHREAKVILTFGAFETDSELAVRFPWLRDLGVELRWAPPELFAEQSWLGTAAQRFRYRFDADVVLLLDADTLVVGPLDELVDETATTGTFAGVIAHMAPVASVDQWAALYRAAGLDGSPALAHEHTGWGALFDEPALRYCPPYFNLGVLCAPAALAERIGHTIWQDLRAVERVLHTDYRAQIAVALAIGRGIPYRTLPMRWNFPNDPRIEARHASELPQVRIAHLLRDHQLRKQGLFASPENFAALLARTDLLGVNARAQEALREIRPALAGHAHRS